MGTISALQSHEQRKTFSWVLVDNGSHGVDLFKVWSGGGSVLIANFATQDAALAFVQGLPAARVVML